MMMKKMLLCLCSLAIACSLFGQESFSRERKIQKTFPVIESTTLEINNKYGDIVFNTWEKDSVKITVNIKAESTKEENVDQLMELAVVELERKGSYIIGGTNWGKNTSFWNKSINEISRAFGADQKIEINYTIYTPNRIPIDVTNKFGDVYLPPYHGSTRIDVSHGDLRCRKLTQPKSISVSYGKALLDDLGTGRITLEFAELRNKQAIDLTVVSRSSEIHIDKAHSLNFNSRNDDLYLGEIARISGNFSFSTNEVKQLLESADLNTSYGSLELKSISPTFKAISLTPTRSTVTIHIGPTLNFNFSVYLRNGEEFASVPKKITITNEKKTEEGRLIEGYWGTGNPHQKVYVNGERAVIKIAQN